ncbi:hypothetical protein [Spiroplasma endosymbiont of Megaselia nigra]|uniref:hypothetical protein n=1 Tax=Spiroplasma endosymbiont of Megaselia nigra TaxID=2478537 RepID=UPI000F8759B2|nr:hypothetical protein [Spiroplasma endosymbiont of Megaselia nigra]RUO86342.1 hypothetical protein D9R21_03610 [Spiroplasma endosymbiont of Megaselia nigra]
MLKSKNNFFLSRYDIKDERILGVYDTYKEAIKEVYGYEPGHSKYENAYAAICASANNVPNSKGEKRSAYGFWYKIFFDNKECD